MKPDLGIPYEPTWSGAPPHMAPFDLPLWTRYHRAHANEWTAVYYDVALGEGATFPEKFPLVQEPMWRRITKQRADAVILKPTGWTIVEVRPAAGPAALGALLSYVALWQADPPDSQPLAWLLITDVDNADLLRAAATLNVPIQTV